MNAVSATAAATGRCPRPAQIQFPQDRPITLAVSGSTIEARSRCRWEWEQATGKGLTSVSRYYSPYAAPHGPSRWPWVILLVVVLALGVAGGAVYASGSVDGMLETVGLSSKKTPEKPAAVVNVPTRTPETARDAGPSTPTATVAHHAATAENDNSSPTTQMQSAAVDQQRTAATGSPTTQDVAQASPAAANQAAAAEQSPTDLVKLYGDRWSAGDYSGLYDLLTADAQKTVTRDDFVSRYQGIAAEAGLASVKLSVTGQPNLQAEVPVHVVMESHLVGEITQDNIVPVAKQDGSWRIAWTPSLIFKDLGNDCVDFAAEDVQRGSILDRNGKPLAVDGTISQVGIVPGQVTDEADMLKKLSKLIDMKPDDIKAKYANGQPDWFMPVKDFPEHMDQKLLNAIEPLDGVAVRTQVGRVYPLGAKAAHITGYVTAVTQDDLDKDKTGTLVAGEVVGRAGVEAGANDLLSGKPGGTLRIVDCGSRRQKAEIATRKAVPAKDIVLTIDSDLQIAVDKALGNVKGSAVVLDPRTGAVLAMASHPSFDPNWFVLGFSDKDWAFVNDEKERPLVNRATQATYPTGSIFKVITMAAAIEDLGYNADTQIDCPSQWSIPGTSQIWKDWTVDEGLGAQGMMSLHTALVQSCNTVFYQLGYKLDEKDNELLPKMAKEFGLGRPTGIQYFGEEVAGTVPDPEWKRDVIGDYWATGDAVNLAIGQGYLAATPLQMAVAYAAIGNNGSILRPFIAQYAKTPGGATEEIGKRKGVNSLPISRDHLQMIQDALRDQTSNTWGGGSSKVFAGFDYPIAGKTGTAQNELDRSGKMSFNSSTSDALST